MGATLHLGVYDVIYDHGEGAGNDAVTTGQVAQILEDKYHIMETFYEAHEVAIVDTITDSMAGALETMMMGGPKMEDPFAEGMSKVASMFKDYLSSGEIEETATPGVPTKAALRRRSLRFKSKKATARRPSFIDTGLMQSSSVAWIDGLEWASITTGLPVGVDYYGAA